MLASQQRKLNQYQSKITFINANKPDFPADSPGGRTNLKLAECVENILSLAALQSSNLLNQRLEVKADNLDKLIRLLRKMNRAGNSLADEHEGIESLFRLPRRRSQQTWIAAARAFHRDSEDYDEEFQDYHLPATFRADLMTLIEAVENSKDGVVAAGTQKSGATGALDDAFREAGKYSRKLDGIVENKYDDNPQKLAEWKIASHLQSAPKRNDGNGEEPK